MRGETQADVVLYFEILRKRFEELGLYIECTMEYFLIRGPEDDENREACNVRTLHELEAYLRGVQSVCHDRIPSLRTQKGCSGV